MEVKENHNAAWLDESHPNYEKWKRARDIASKRGLFVRSIIKKKINCENLTILDLGSGQGGTAKILSENNKVISLDLNIVRLKSQEDFKDNIQRINGDALSVPLKSDSFDLIILQDVIEHVNDPKSLLISLQGLLKKNGILYLSTPNKLSVFNIISDPHWGLPFVSLLKRKSIGRYFLKNFRKSESERKDIAQLLSLKELMTLFSNKFNFTLFTSYAVEELLKGNKGIIWSDFHLALLKLTKLFRFDQLLLGIVNDKPGLINKFFTPTFYALLEKK
jgi:2-polyprenyl-3-methyl-5-hydroxy-6-metoxy-1,4-benzoquinol methylase